jgi:ABC-type phosphate/phosphonate transport system substrate-binding protein
MAAADSISPRRRRSGAMLYAALLCAASLVAAPGALAGGKKIVFGIVPQQSATRLAEIWVPLIERVSHDTGLAIQFATTATIPIFEACLKAKAFDLAYMNPYHYVVVSRDSNYRALVHSTEPLQGILVTRKDSAIADVKGLEGLEVAFPAPAAFGASILPRAELAAANVTITARYVLSHDSVYQAVANGLLPAGGGIIRTWDNLPAAIKDRLRILYSTARYTPHAIAASEAIDAPTAQKITDALAALDRTAAPLLKPLGIQHFQPAQDSDWDDIRQLRISMAQSGFEDRAQRCPFD